MTTHRAFAPRHPGKERWRHRVTRSGAVVVLASGGLDSCALIGHMARKGREVFPLFIEAGMTWETAEIRSLKRFLSKIPPALARRVRPLKILSVRMDDLYGDHWSTTGRGVPGWRATDSSVYLPGRNIMLLSKGGVYAATLGVPAIAIGTLAGNPFPDGTAAFFRILGRALSAGLGFPLTIEAPFRKLGKEEIMKRYTDLPLKLSFSCSNPRRLRPCGVCAKCRERILAEASPKTPRRRPAAGASR